MKKILLFGAGKSATSLIRYLLEVTASRSWQLVVAESNLALAESKLAGAPQARAVGLDVNPGRRSRYIGKRRRSGHLPAAACLCIMGSPISCLMKDKHLLTASYLDDPIRALEAEIRDRGLFFLCEMGLDPGIDHMSALQLIRSIESEGGAIRQFHSQYGGLVAPRKR